MNRTHWRLLMGTALIVGAGCSGTTPTTTTPSLSLDATPASILNDGSKANLLLTATTADGKPGSGTIDLIVDYGDINGNGASTAKVTLSADGTATASFSCDIQKDTKCEPNKPVTFKAAWQGESTQTRLFITSKAPIDAGPVDAGYVDAGYVDAGPVIVDAGPNLDGATLNPVSVFPQFIVVGQAVDPDAGSATDHAEMVFNAKAKDGLPLVGYSVTFAEPLGQRLVSFSSAAVVTDTNGDARVTVRSGSTPGIAQVDATFNNNSSITAKQTVKVLGVPTLLTTPTKAEECVEGSLDPNPSPGILGVRGSGIQEQGQAYFIVRDNVGNPVPGVLVNFSEEEPRIVDLTNTSESSNEKGCVRVSYVSGPSVGVTTLNAVVALTGASARTSVAVQGAKPSARNFHFSCSKLNLPVYVLVDRNIAMECTVRLADRNGQRIGVPTRVVFATETGAITASGLTQGYGAASEQDVGTLKVQFNSATAVTTGPADVAPFSGNGVVEPQLAAANGIVRNPRDQLVTIIAFTRGEEEFFDGNNDGDFTPNVDTFVDLSDPFVDENDDGICDSVSTNGRFENRFGGSAADGGSTDAGRNACPGWSAGNGQFDRNGVIWTQTEVAFTGAAERFSFVDPMTTFLPTVGGETWTGWTFYSQNNPQASCSKSAFPDSVHGYSQNDLFVTDGYLNSLAIGTSFNLDTPPGSLSNGTSIQKTGFTPISLESTGSVNLTQVITGQTTQLACDLSNGPCRRRPRIGAFGSRNLKIGTVTLRGSKIPDPGDPTNQIDGTVCGSTYQVTVTVSANGASVPTQETFRTEPAPGTP